MKKSVIILSIISSLITLSCENKTSTKPQIDKKLYYHIKLNESQIMAVGKTRLLLLTKKQSKLLKNKLTKFNVGGPKYFAPEGWFYANWIKKDEVIIEKHLIDNFKNLVDSSKFENNNFESRSIKINIDINGSFYIKSNSINVSMILKKIDQFSKRYNIDEISVYISYAPLNTNSNLYKKVKNSVTAIEKHSKSKGIHFQDDF